MLQPSLKRSQIMRIKPVSEPKPKKGQKQRTCSICKAKYLPSQALQKVCGIGCAIEAGRVIQAKQKAKAARA